VHKERRWNKQTSACDSKRFYSGDKRNFSVESEQALLLFFFFWLALECFGPVGLFSLPGHTWELQVLGWDDSPDSSRLWDGAASIHCLPCEPCRASGLSFCPPSPFCSIDSRKGAPGLSVCSCGGGDPRPSLMLQYPGSSRSCHLARH